MATGRKPKPRAPARPAKKRAAPGRVVFDAARGTGIDARGHYVSRATVLRRGKAGLLVDKRGKPFDLSVYGRTSGAVFEETNAPKLSGRSKYELKQFNVRADIGLSARRLAREIKKMGKRKRMVKGTLIGASLIVVTAGGVEIGLAGGLLDRRDPLKVSERGFRGWKAALDGNKHIYGFTKDPDAEDNPGAVVRHYVAVRIWVPRKVKSKKRKSRSATTTLKRRPSRKGR